MNIKKILLAGTTAGFLAVVTVTGAFAASTVVVTPSNPQGWSTSDTRPGGNVATIADATSPYPTGALQLTTDATTTAKAQYLHAANDSLSTVTELGYHTKQNSGPSFAAASYQLILDINGGTLADGGFTTMVYEPYQNGVVTNGTWQQWDVAAGQMWSSRSVTDGGSCVLSAGFGGAPFYTLAGLQANCPNAVVIGFGVNIGSNNPSYDVETDGVNYNGTTYDFELDPVATPTPSATPTPLPVPTSKDACKNGGYKTLTDQNGNPFKNQGQCVSYVNHNS